MLKKCLCLEKKSELFLKNCKKKKLKFIVIDGVLYNDKYLILYRIKNLKVL